jgi:PBSX family phage terminase large subunit
VKLSTPQKTVANDPARFVVLVAGRRVGKTTLGIRQLFYHARLPDQNVAAILPSYRQARNVWWDEVKKKAISLCWDKKINEADLSIVLKNGSKISLKGSDNRDALRGSKYHYLYLDEVASIDKEAYTEVLRPTLSDTGGRAMFAGTPKGISNWLYDIYQKGQDPTEPNWSSHQFTTVQGGFVTPEEVEQAKAELDAKVFKQEYEGTFENYEGRIYYGFERQHNVDDFSFEQRQNIIHIGIDFNVHPLTAICFVIKDNKMYVIDEIEMYGSNTEELANEIHNRFPGTKIIAYPDPSGRARKTNSPKTDFHILSNAGFIVKAPSRHIPVRDRINAVNSKFCSGTGERGIMIHPKCKSLITAMERHIYKEGTSQPEKNGSRDYSHISDALGYATSFLFPITRTYESTEQQNTWKVRI